VNLVGAWHLQSWEVRTEAGTQLPFGAEPCGLLTYTADGYMQASISVAGRPVLSGSSPRQASAEEQASAFRSFFSYAGRYELRDLDVVHHVEIALNPAMVGTDQVRHAEMADDVLVLTADEFLSNGSARGHRLTWRRASRHGGIA
jgi:hypothetical protein